jgi:thiol-disulfide isomerase/thioredoxin
MLLKRIFLVTILLVFNSTIADASPSLSERLLANNFNLFSAPGSAGNMVLQDFKGKIVNLASLKGKVVILNFWKIDCPPCSVEKPILERVYRKFAPYGLEVVCVNLFDEPEKLRSYVGKMGFSFFIGYDPAARLKVKQQVLSRGKTNFVVNEKLEAIYEVPGVPTTYLINRAGKVIGTSAGLINWEEEPFDELLTSTLGVPNRNVNAESFRVAAGQGGPVSNPTPMSQEPENVIETPPPSTPDVGIPEETKKRQKPKSDKAVRSQKNLDSAQTRIEKQNPPATVVDKAELRKPQPYTPGKPLKPTVHNDGKSTASAKIMGREIVPIRSELPPAIPYTPGAKTLGPGQQAGTPLSPDDSGSVMAQIPGNAANQQPLLHPSSSNGQLPPARPLGASNSLDGFILDSFGQSAAPYARSTAQNQQTPQPSIAGQLGQDVRNLGSGIKETFSRMWGR